MCPKNLKLPTLSFPRCLTLINEIQNVVFENIAQRAARTKFSKRLRFSKPLVAMSFSGGVSGTAHISTEIFRIISIT